ncbi:unnamed protein product, partial [Notodromas monacha]
MKPGQIMVQPRIVNGNRVSDRRTRPYMVRLQDPSTTNPFCAGSLVSVSYVLTAAHCTDGVALERHPNTELGDSGTPVVMVIKGTPVQIGVHNSGTCLPNEYPIAGFGAWASWPLQVPIDEPVIVGGTTVTDRKTRPYLARLENPASRRAFCTGSLSNAIRPSDWVDSGAFEMYDMSFLPLPRAAILNDYVQIIPVFIGFSSNNFEGTTLTLSGWGITGEFRAGRASDTLQTAQIEGRSCINNPHGPADLCYAGSGGTSTTCSGDSGTPVVLEINGTVMQIGIHNAGLCTLSTKGPGAFANGDAQPVIAGGTTVTDRRTRPYLVRLEDPSRHTAHCTGSLISLTYVP